MEIPQLVPSKRKMEKITKMDKTTKNSQVTVNFDEKRNDIQTLPKKFNPDFIMAGHG